MVCKGAMLLAWPAGSVDGVSGRVPASATLPPPAGEALAALQSAQHLRWQARRAAWAGPWCCQSAGCHQGASEARCAAAAGPAASICLSSRAVDLPCAQNRQVLTIWPTAEAAGAVQVGLSTRLDRRQAGCAEPGRHPRPCQRLA